MRAPLAMQWPWPRWLPTMASCSLSAAHAPVATGACAALSEQDAIVGNHRGHGHCIAKGARIDRMMAELMGRETGYCRGLGGSMHIAALDLNILGCNGIVAAGLPHGPGAALANRIR